MGRNMERFVSTRRRDSSSTLTGGKDKGRAGRGDVNRSADMADVHWDNYHWRSPFFSGKYRGKSLTEHGGGKCGLEV